MAQGRMIRRELAGSDRFFQLTDRTRWVYALAMAFTDRDGFLPACGRELSTLFLGGLVPSWEAIESLVSDIVDTGLWRAFTDADGRQCIHVHKFAEHQELRNYLHELPSIYSLPLSGEHDPPELREDRETQVRPGGGSRTREPRAGAGSGSRSGSRVRREEKRTQEKGREEKGSRPSRILEAYSRAMEDENLVAIPLIKDQPSIEEAERIGTCDRFTTRDSLIAEFRRTIAGLNGKGYATTVTAVLGNIGGDWQKEPAKRPGSGGTYEKAPGEYYVPGVEETNRMLAETFDMGPEGETDGEG